MNHESLQWKYDTEGISFSELSELYRIAPLGTKNPDYLRTVFANSMYKIIVFRGNQIIAAGRALADGADCSYICDIAVHPDFQGTGLGKRIVQELMKLSEGHKKIILYSNPGKEGFYKKLGFRLMKTAMAVFQDTESAEKAGLIY